MTGILERIEAQNAQILALLQGGGTANVAPAPVDPAAAAAAAAQAAAAEQRRVLEAQLAALNAGTPPAAPVTPPAGAITAEMITALIMPNVDNPTIKEALGADMRSMGINALPEAQPHQYGDLYAKFQATIARLSGPAAAAAPVASTASII